MAVGPFGPWVTAGSPPPAADPWGVEPDAEGWRTGTAIDEFTPIYLALGRADPKRHGPIAPGDADLLDLSVVAALLGVGATDDFESAAADLNRRRLAAEREGRPFTWEDT